ncbi:MULTISPECIES: hypothetical protein [Streptomyces]|uniref:hypothetical protein n=1 Tax=Streptomyces TaxID=1883 RepID=UPI003460582B
MAIRTAHSGGRAVRWAYGVFLTLFVALAVLVHHETAAMGASQMGASHVMSASSMAAMDASSMTGTAHAAQSGAAHAAHVMPGEAAPAAWESSSAHSVDNGGCATPGMQLCTTASVASVQLAEPGEDGFSLLPDLREATTGPTPAGTVGRAPPDLSVLSLLRI